MAGAVTHSGVMNPTGKLPLQPWMTAPATVAVLKALSAGGAEVRFIGGCVRDALLKRPIRDIDIATPERPSVVMERLRAAGILVIPTGIDHGTVTAVVDGTPFEITTLRLDVETDGRRAKVAFTDDWVADAARRDFTINAFSCTQDGDIYDPFRGLEDLGQGVVRFVGNAQDRIREDVLRLLRFFRFHATYGRPPADPDALAACRVWAHTLPVLSGERVRVELYRILMAPNPADTLNLMRGQGVLEHFLPEAGETGRLRVMAWLDTRAIRVESVAPHPVRRLGSLLATDETGVQAVASRLHMSNRHRQRLLTLIAGPVLTPGSDRRARRRALRHLGPDAVRDLVLLAWAAEVARSELGGSVRSRAWLEMIEEADSWTPVQFPLRGRDVLALGIRHGPRVGRILKQVETWWEEADYRPDHAACLAKLEEVLRSYD